MSEKEKSKADKCECCGRNKTMIIAVVALSLAIVSIMAVMSLKNYISSRRYVTRRTMEQYVNAVIEGSKDQTPVEKSVDCKNATSEADKARCDWASENSYGFTEE